VEAASDLERNASESSSRSLPTECRLCSSIHLSKTDNERAGPSLLRFTKEALSPLHCSQKPAPLTVATVKLFSQAKHRLAMPLISLCIRALSLLHPLLSGGLPSLVSPATLFLRSSTPLSLSSATHTLSPSSASLSSFSSNALYWPLRFCGRALGGSYFVASIAACYVPHTVGSRLDDAPHCRTHGIICIYNLCSNELQGSNTLASRCLDCTQTC